MDPKVLAIAIASAIAAIVSLIVAVMNWRTSHTLERVKRSYDLISHDLDRLLKIKMNFYGISIPSEAQIKKALNADKLEMNKQLQDILDETLPLFRQLCEVFKVNEDIFDDSARSEFTKATNGSNDWVGGELIGRLLIAITAIKDIVVDQIERTRQRLLD